MNSLVTKYVDGNERSVTANIPEWVSACTLAASDEDYFQKFRQERIFQEVVEGTSYMGGVFNLRKLLKLDNFKLSLPEISKSDYYGCPSNKITFSLNSKTYSLNPTTLRYANNAFNVMDIFGQEIFSKSFNEIGGGYGGDCKAFNDLAKIVLGRNVDWNIYDLPSSKGLIKKWLDIFGYSAEFKDLNELIESKKESIVISCGALSEMRGELLKEYIEKVVLKANYGYFITNFETHSLPYGGWSTEEFIEHLKLGGKQDVKILDSRQYLSYFDYQAGSKLIIFGAKFSPQKFKISSCILWIILDKMEKLKNKYMFWYMRG